MVLSRGRGGEFIAVMSMATAIPPQRRLTLRLEGNIGRNRGGLEFRIQTIRHRNTVRLAVAPLRPFGAARRHRAFLIAKAVEILSDPRVEQRLADEGRRIDRHHEMADL